jgi:hypothetical protein
MSIEKKVYPEIVNEFLQRTPCSVRMVKKVADVLTYLLDFSYLRIRLSDRTPLIDLLDMSLKLDKENLIFLLEQIILEGGFRERIPIVLVNENSSIYNKLALEKWIYAIFIDTNDAHNMIYTHNINREFLNIATSQLPLSVLSPYETTRPVIASNFFGREYELRNMLLHADTNYAIMGARRIGKTSLLQEFHRRADNELKNRIYYFDCSTYGDASDFIYELVNTLYVKEIQRLRYKDYRLYLPTFLDRMRKMYGGRIVLLLDEADNLIDLDKRSNYPILLVLRRSTNVGSCRCIFAGFREVYKQAQSLESPFYNFTTPMILSSMSIDQTRQLILSPMRNLNIEISNEEQLVHRKLNFLELFVV